MGQKWQLMSYFIQVREKEAKKAKKGYKNGHYPNKNWHIKTTKPVIKNPLGYVFSQCNTISKNKNKFDFGQKWQILSSFAKKPQI